MASSDNQFDDSASFGAADQPLFDEPITKKPLGVLAFALQAALLVTGLFWLAHLAADAVLNTFDETGSADWNVAYDRTQLTQSMALLFCGVSAVLLIWWTTWAYRNLDAAAKASENPKQVLLSWFIPIINLLIPARVLEELSVGAAPEDHPRRLPRLVWYFWVAGPVTLFARFGILLLEPLVFPSGNLSTVFTVVGWITSLLIATACLTGIIVIRKTTILAETW